MTDLEAYRKRVSGSANRIMWRQQDLQAIAHKCGLKGYGPIEATPRPIPTLYKIPTSRGEPDISRQFTFVISTSDLDRSSDIINVNGWSLRDYHKSPVVLWSHRASELPVGRAVRTWVENGQLKSTVQLAPADANPESEQLFKLISGGFCSACSVGFIPLTFSFARSKDRPYGIDFETQSLTEWSICTVGSNPAALLVPIPPPNSAVQSSKDNGAFAVRRIAAAKRQREVEALKQGI
jgi:HK97 family phage prohead protease